MTEHSLGQETGEYGMCEDRITSFQGHGCKVWFSLTTVLADCVYIQATPSF